MPVTATDSTTQAATIGQAPSTPRSDRGLSSLKSEDFFKILVTELQQQDPMKPSNTSDMISNVSQIRSIELSGKLSDSLDAIAKQQRTAGTSELIGKYVTAQSTGVDGVPVQKAGVVTGVRFNSDGVAILELDSGDSIVASDVTEITSLDEMAKRAGQSKGVQAASKDMQEQSLLNLKLFNDSSKLAAKARKQPLKALGTLFHL